MDHPRSACGALPPGDNASGQAEPVHCVGLTRRRELLASGLVIAAPALMLPRLARASAEAEAALRSGGVVIAFRHALAPGTYDPPGFKFGECSTQRNLSEEGRGQARRIGLWFNSRGLVPATVRASPWCRCVDTATLAFSQPQTWAALGSPRAGTEATNAASLAALRQALSDAGAQRGRFEAWVTHQFVLNDLAGRPTQSGEGLVLRATSAGQAEVLASLMIV